MGGILQRFKTHDELYWNVTGHEWDTTINSASAKVESPFATIENATCFAGPYRSQSRHCTTSRDANQVTLSTTQYLRPGDDFTVVVALDPDNSLTFPSFIQKAGKTLVDNWAYLIPLTVLGLALLLWYQKGRDIRFAEDYIFYRKEDAQTERLPLFAREHLPLAYRPIDGLTPAEVGTIIDERVDTKDVIAEIVELARLGFIKIKKLKKKGWFKKDDYLLTKLKRGSSKLKNHQKYLLRSLFSKNSPEVKLSQLEGNFYSHLEEFKNLLYQGLVEQKIFASNPEHARWGYLSLAFLLAILGNGFLALTASLSGNYGPSIFYLFPTTPLLFLVAYKMPRRTAWGHSLYRQAKGLQFYLEKGKWRQEIQEKHLFFEEILPLTISLGLVRKLARGMEKLGVKPPEYFQTDGLRFYPAFKSFAASASTNLAVNPSGKSSWSGGSGFSGGFSGGGFGGGGGSSW